MRIRQHIMCIIIKFIIIFFPVTFILLLFVFALHTPSQAQNNSENSYRGAAIAGTVVDVSGNGIADVKVTVTAEGKAAAPNTIVASATSRADGSSLKKMRWT